jgi:hypothetical protein
VPTGYNKERSLAWRLTLKTNNMNTQEEILEVLMSAFDALDYISDRCDELSLDEIKMTANGELAELEELIIKLTKNPMFR